MSDGTKLKAVIADDHPIMRNAVREVLEKLDRFEIVEEVDNGLDAVRAARVVRPDLMVLDISMPYARGSEVFLEVRRQSPETRIAVFTGLSSTGLLSDLVAANVDGLFLKKGNMSTLSRGLELVAEGAKFVAPDVVALLEHQPPASDLSPRERQTLNFVAQGLTNAEIGARLNISPKTVDNHRTSLMAKLNVNSAAALLAYALREGLLEGSAQN